jgi:hypothetical protein
VSLRDIYLFAEVADSFAENSEGADLAELGAVQRERRLAAALHVQIQQFFLGLESAMAAQVTESVSRGRLLQLALAAATEVDLRVDEGSPEMFDLFAFMQSLGSFPFDASYSAGFAPDGSVSVLVGPDLPRFEEAGIGGGAEHDARDLEAALRVAKDCTVLAARLKVRLDEADFQQHQGRTGGAAARLRADGSGPSVEPENGESGARDDDAFQIELVGGAAGHFSIWAGGSEWGWVWSAVEILGRAGLISDESPLARAHSVAAVVTLWALSIEFTAHTGEGTPGDWTYDVSCWIDEGLTQDDLRLLNEDCDLGWDFDDAESEVDAAQLLREVIAKHHAVVTNALLAELGEAFLFASMWATRLDVDYPLDGEVVNDIVNDDLGGEKQGGYAWLDSGMAL